MTIRRIPGTLKTNADSVSRINIRYKPDGSDVKTDREQGTRVDAIDVSAPDSKGHTWHYIGYEDFGWVRDDVIDFDVAEESSSVEEAQTITDGNTRLFFKTKTRIVRVFKGDEHLHMNVYNKDSDKTELFQVKAICLPEDVNVPQGAEVLWRSYVAEKNGKVCIARFVRLKETQLIISDAIDGEVSSREPGFGSQGTAYT